MKVLKRSTWLHGPTFEMTKDEHLAYKFGIMYGSITGFFIACVLAVIAYFIFIGGKYE